MGVNDELLTVYGVDPGKKGEGVTRLIMRNTNGVNTILMDNKNLEKAR